MDRRRTYFGVVIGTLALASAVALLIHARAPAAVGAALRMPGELHASTSPQR